MIARVCLVQFYVGGLDVKFPARRHSVSRIHCQVHDHLLDLALIGFDISELRIQGQGHVDILAQQAWKHFFHVRYERIQAQDGRCQNLLSAESQQLASQRSSALARFFDFRGIFVSGLTLVQGLLQYTAIPDDDSEQIVEIMAILPITFRWPPSSEPFVAGAPECVFPSRLPQNPRNIRGRHP